MTPTQIKHAYETGDNGYFFTCDTMRFFGDTMRSFGARRINGVQYLYREPSARVNVFGTWKTAGREFFGAWKFDETTGDLDIVSDEIKDMIYAEV